MVEECTLGGRKGRRPVLLLLSEGGNPGQGCSWGNQREEKETVGLKGKVQKADYV